MKTLEQIIREQRQHAYKQFMKCDDDDESKLLHEGAFTALDVVLRKWQQEQTDADKT